MGLTFLTLLMTPLIRKVKNDSVIIIISINYYSMILQKLNKLKNHKYIKFINRNLFIS